MEAIASLAAVVGAEHVREESAARELGGHDLFAWPGRVTPDLVVSPSNTEETAAVLDLAAENSTIVPRGGGLSYTGGVVPHRRAVVVDTTRMTSIAVHAENLTAVVGAGCTWSALADALAPHSLRPALPGPISGSHSTVGGAVSQNLPGSMDGVVGLTVVLAEGEIVRTGSGALSRSVPFWRLHGPDLTGIFQGDCGAFGVKTDVALRLEHVKPAAFLSFAFSNADDAVASFVTLLQRGLVSSRAFAIDRARTNAAQKPGTGEAWLTVAGVVRGAGSMRQAVRDVASLARGQGDLSEAPWSLHLTVEAATEAGAEAQAEAARIVCARAGREIEPAAPKAMRGRPFTLRGFLGPKGERWVPVHGIVPLSRARECSARIEAYWESAREEFDAHGIGKGCLLTSSGAYMLFEPMLLWPDALGPVQAHYLSPRDRERFGGSADNPAARAVIARVRTELRDLLDEMGAVQVQIGRFYQLTDAVDEGTRAVLARLKASLDPRGRMNPGVLGL